MTHYTSNRHTYCAYEMFSAACLEIVHSRCEAPVEALSSLAEELRKRSLGHTRLGSGAPGEGWDRSAEVYAAIAEALEKHVAARAMAKDFDATEEVR